MNTSPDGIITIRNFFQKRMSVHIFNGPLYRTFEVYIDDLVFHGQNDEDFVIITRQIFQICREEAGHKYEKRLNMKQARIESTVAFTKSGTLKEPSSFLVWSFILGIICGTTPNMRTA